MRRIQMESNLPGVACVDPAKQLRFPIAAGPTDEDNARSFEILVDLGSQRLFDWSLQTGSKSGTGTLAGIGVRGFDSVMTGASPGFAATDSIFLQCIQLRDVAFQRRDRSGGAFRQGCYQFFEIHVRRSVSFYGLPAFAEGELVTPCELL